MSPAPPQGTRKGYPYHTTKRPTRPMHGRGGACPHPGESGANPRQRLTLMCMGRDQSGPYAPGPSLRSACFPHPFQMCQGERSPSGPALPGPLPVRGLARRPSTGASAGRPLARVADHVAICASELRSSRESAARSARLAQLMLALAHLFGQQRERGRDKGPFLGASIRGVGFAYG